MLHAVLVFALSFWNMLDTSPSELPAPLLPGAADIRVFLTLYHWTLSHAHFVHRPGETPNRREFHEACCTALLCNVRMHPRNRYSKKKPDFWELAEFRPSLKPFLIKKERGRKSGIHETPPTRTSTCSGTPDAPSTATPNDPLTVTPNAPPTVTPDAPPTVTPDDLVTVHVIPEATPTSTSDAGTASAPSDTAAMERHKYAYTMNFSDVDGTRELTCALLEKDFDLRVEIPVGSLVPTVPQKLNYIHWVEDLLSYGGVACLEEGGASEQQIPRGKDIVGIDIGKSRLCNVG